MNRITMALVLAGAGVCAAADTGATAFPEVMVDVDVNDEAYIRTQVMTEEDVRTLVAQLKENGCQTLIVRAGCLGLLPYRTDLSYPYAFDVDHARQHWCSYLDGVSGGDQAKYLDNEIAWNARYAQAIGTFNPPAVFIRAAHAQGMKAIVWIDLFDDHYPGYRSKFLEQNPHCQWVGKDGKTRFKGLTDYAWPEARAFRVAQARELLDLGADGIHCSTSAHCRHLPNVHEEDFYGYSEPIVEAFQRKYGVDIRTAANFDRAAWHDLKGEAMVQLYRDLAKLCHERGKELWVGLQLGRYTQFAADDHFSTNVVARYANHWKTLVDEGIADAFILGDYEQVSVPGSSYWTAKPDVRPREGEDLFAWAAREYQAHCKGKTRLYLFGEWLPGPAELEARLRFFGDRIVKHGFDGIDLHEASNFEGDPAGMKALRTFADHLKGTVPSR